MDLLEKPEVDESAGAIRIIMSFVIKKGEISTSSVIRSSDKKLDSCAEITLSKMIIGL